MGTEEYSIVIDGEELRVTVEEENGAVYVRSSEEEGRIRAEIKELDEGIYQLRLDEQQIIFGRGGNGEKEDIYVNDISFEADVCLARFREDEAGPKQGAGTGDLYSINASIPGQVLEVSVEEDDELESGQTVLLLSAMKLENEIQTNESGVVEHIHVAEGDTVEKGQLLMEIRV